MYDRTGTLFEGPYEAIQVESDKYLRHLCRYIHANPVRHALALAPDLWPYSNYLEWIGQRSGTLVDRNFVNAHFPQPQQYRAYVNSYLTGQVQLPDGLRTYLDSLFDVALQPSRKQQQLPGRGQAHSFPCSTQDLMSTSFVEGAFPSTKVFLPARTSR